MATRIITISYTGLNSSGGVPRWNRDIMKMCELNGWDHQHFSYDDIKNQVNLFLPEWEYAKILNGYLTSKKIITKNDIILADGFWGLGLEWHENVISVSHGNWSHTTYDDVLAGIKPEFPLHHTIQVEYRRKHLAAGKKMVAVSKFIAEQCKLQWNFDMPYINNGIDTLNGDFKATNKKIDRDKKIIIHGTTTANKGFDHIDLLKKENKWDVLLLDEAAEKFKLTKAEALAQADLVVHPSAHEGNSYFILETMACNVPIVAYDVGYLYEVKQNEESYLCGEIIKREFRCPRDTEAASRIAFENMGLDTGYYDSFSFVNDISNFNMQWTDFIRGNFL